MLRGLEQPAPGVHTGAAQGRPSRHDAARPARSRGRGGRRRSCRSTTLTAEILADAARAASTMPRRRTASTRDRPRRAGRSRRCRCACTAPTATTACCPCVYSMHGGGYVIGTNTMDDPFFDALCPELGFVGVSVEYRLAPETPYPGPLEDCYRGLQWTLRARRRARHRPGLHRRDGRERGRRSRGRARAARARPRRGAARVPAPRPADARRPPGHAVEHAGRPRGVEPRARTRSGGSRTSATSTAATTSRRPRRRRARPTSPACRPRSCRSARSTASATKTSTTRCGSTRPACRRELHVYPGACHGFNVLAPDAAVSKQCRAQHGGLAARGSFTVSAPTRVSDRGGGWSPTRGRAAW